MPYFAELENNVVVSLLESQKRPDYEAAGKTAVEVDSMDYINGHYNGTTVDKCPDGMRWDSVSGAFVAQI